MNQTAVLNINENLNYTLLLAEFQERIIDKESLTRVISLQSSKRIHNTTIHDGLAGGINLGDCTSV